MGGYRDMLFLAFRVRETKVDELDVFLLNQAITAAAVMGCSSRL